MINVPHAIVDFAAALKLLAESQSDVSELVTKWDLICNTYTPMTVDITLSNGVHKVDNLAKIRNDLIKGLSLKNPTVVEIKYRTNERDYGRQTASQLIGNSWYAVGENPFDANSSGWKSCLRFLDNDVRSVCFPDTGDIHADLMGMPRVVVLGVPVGNGQPVTEVTIHLSAPSANWASDNLIGGDKQLYAVTMFVNRNFGGYGSAAIAYPGNPVTLHVYDATGVRLFTREIPPAKCVSYMFFAGPGQNTVNFHELMPA